MDEITEELVFFDLLAAREAALNAAVGQLIADNVPTNRIEALADSTSEIISLAARIVLHERDAYHDRLTRFRR